MRKPPQKAEKTEPDWKKIGPCHYRYRSRGYYALVKQQGKQIRRSLDTEDLALARRRLADLRRDIEQTDPTLATRTIKAHGDLFLATLTKATWFLKQSASPRSKTSAM